MKIQNKNLITGKFKLSLEEEKFIRNRVAELPKQERLAIYCLFWEQHSLLRIASDLGVSVSDVARLISDAMEKLRPQLTHIADDYFGVVNTEFLEQVA